MAFTVVGTSELEATITGTQDDYTIPLPTGTTAGDLIIVGTQWGFVNIDARLTGEVEAVITGGAGKAAVAWGVVGSDTSDLDIRFPANYTRNAIIVTIRGKGVPTFADAIKAPSDTYEGPIIEATTAYTTGVAFWASSRSGDPSYDVGTASGWTNLVEAKSDDGSVYHSLRAGWWDDTELAELTVTGVYSDGGWTAAYTLWAPPSARYLRQRQSPRRTPSRVRGVDLRARQTPLIR